MSETDRASLVVAGNFWQATYRNNPSDLFAGQALLRALSADPGWTHSDLTRLRIATKWLDCGAPRLTVEPRFAAALMCSRVADDLRDDLLIPWKTFRVEVPAGVLGFGKYSFERIWVAQFDDAWWAPSLENLARGAFERRPQAVLFVDGSRPAEPGDPPGAGGMVVPIVSYGESLADLLLNQEEMSTLSVDGARATEEKARLDRLARRLIVGLLYTHQFTTHFRPAPPSLNDPRRGLRDGPPKHRTIIFGKPISYDVRSACRDYVDGKRGSAPSVQTLVRGHYKRQVVGVSRSGRKVIWVEPYWRGPEDAPILARPYTVGPKETAQ